MQKEGVSTSRGGLSIAVDTIIIRNRPHEGVL
jgi:hypothetical protein